MAVSRENQRRAGARRARSAPATACDTAAASGAMAETIPPSLVLIAIASVTGVSISALFTGGLLPGVVLAVAFGAGTMTLSLYSLHVVMRTDDVWPPEEPSAYVSHVVVLLTIGAGLRLLGRRGPLEVVAGLPVRLARRAALPQRSGTNR